MSAGSIWIDVDHSNFSIGALPKDRFLVNNGYAVEILVAKNPHFYENLQTQRIQNCSYPVFISFDYGLGWGRSKSYKELLQG